jgi:hypothetical protein
MFYVVADQLRTATDRGEGEPWLILGPNHNSHMGSG